MKMSDEIRNHPPIKSEGVTHVSGTFIPAQQNQVSEHHFASHRGRPIPIANRRSRGQAGNTYQLHSANGRDGGQASTDQARGQGPAQVTVTEDAECRACEVNNGGCTEDRSPPA
jgi:hypothetical protein